jgi:WD40 repeat protein
VSARKEVASLAGHASSVCSVAFSLDGQHIVSGGWDKLVKVWSVSASKEVASLARNKTAIVFIRSPSVLMGNTSFQEVETT